jgi:glycine cleavage system H protein
MAAVPDSLYFNEDHLWAGEAAGLWRIGVTDYAQEHLGDVVEVTPPEVGASVTAGEPCGVIESTKSVSDLIAPITGVVEHVNDALDGSPELVNSDPYGRGWVFEVRAEPAGLSDELARLMSPGGYRQLTGE